MKIKEINKNERPRERLIYNGTDALSDAEILAILIGYGHKNMNAVELAHQIINTYTLEALKEINTKELTQIN